MSQKHLYTYIASGKYRGKKLLLPSFETTRSTKAILKLSFFNTIQFDIMDSAFVEVFAGSGSMGLEAYSRGAKEIVFIERDNAAFKILQQNCAQFTTLDARLIHGDAFQELPKAAQNLKEAAFFYFDPPFDMRLGMEGIYDKTIALLAALPREKVRLAAFEHASTFAMPDAIWDYQLTKTKAFGASSLSFYE
jgi:16S rRNA (guanine(966)-N(2))-methyltransferase RsmD